MEVPVGYTYRDVVKKLIEEGWSLKRTSGSHEIYKHPDGRTCPVKCTGKEIPKGTMKSIERITGIKF